MTKIMEQSRIKLDMTHKDAHETFRETYKESTTGIALWGIYQCYRLMYPDKTPFDLFVMTEEHHIELIQKQDRP